MCRQRTAAAATPTQVPMSGKWPEPGCVTISTPAKPTATAPQRWTPTRSFRTSAASIVPNIGTVKLSVVASASGSKATAPKLSITPNMPIALRTACDFIRVVRTEAKPGPNATKPAMVGRANICRAHNNSQIDTPRASATLVAAYIADSSAMAINRHKMPSKWRSAGVSLTL